MNPIHVNVKSVDKLCITFLFLSIFYTESPSFFNEKTEKGTGARVKKKRNFSALVLFENCQSLALDRVSVGLVSF